MIKKIAYIGLLTSTCMATDLFQNNDQIACFLSENITKGADFKKTLEDAISIREMTTASKSALSFLDTLKILSVADPLYSADCFDATQLRQKIAALPQTIRWTSLSNDMEYRYMNMPVMYYLQILGGERLLSIASTRPYVLDFPHAFEHFLMGKDGSGHTDVLKWKRDGSFDDRYAKAMKYAHDVAVHEHKEQEYPHIGFIELRHKSTKVTHRSYTFPMDAESKPDLSDVPILIRHIVPQTLNYHLSWISEAFEAAQLCHKDDYLKTQALGIFAFRWFSTFPISNEAIEVGTLLLNAICKKQNIKALSKEKLLKLFEIAKTSFSEEEFLKWFMKDVFNPYATPTKTITRPDFEVVIARYKEDYSWIEKEFPTQKVTLYNKGEDIFGLPSNITVINGVQNTGREVYPYMMHVVNNYDTLKDMVVFLQGWPYDHNGRAILDTLKADTIEVEPYAFSLLGPSIKQDTPTFSRGTLIPSSRTRMNYIGSLMKEGEYKDDNKELVSPDANAFDSNVLKKSFSLDQEIGLVYTAQFGVLKENIHKHSKEHYQQIIDNGGMTKYINAAEAFYLEGIWDLVFSDFGDKQ